MDVPIWLAIELRKRNQCDIRLPPWMTLPELKEVVQKEKTASKAKTKGWELDGKTPNRRASISVFKPLS